MKFTKMQGAGNDFIVIDNRDLNLSVEALCDLARKLCPRRLSVGADGLMAVVPPKAGGDFGMIFINADGSVGEMCGNGARCICKYGYEKGIAGASMVVETTAGPVYGQRLSAMEYKVRLNDVTKFLPAVALVVSGQIWNAAYVELGNPGLPHLVVEYPGLARTEPEAIWNLGKALREHPNLPKGANVNFYEITEDGMIFERTFERGVEDFTYACGTGTGSVVTVLSEKGVVSGEHTAVEMAGGTLYVDVVREDGEVKDLYLSGPTVIVYEGERAEL
ncbi:diaminopimelate epimerase [Anaerovoracaceae bacterium 42-11]|nr:diaminopimelate epimerase [Emergencia sp.]